MEASKERREQQKMEMEKKKKKDVDPMAKGREVIRESIMCDNNKGGGGGGATANHPDDILAYSRSVQKVDSSLEGLVNSGFMKIKVNPLIYMPLQLKPLYKL
ncbi:hypothetical protein L1987_47733 [Smallanthus sonchifolius]|uniref:Uncharacterized protein n=1 Tax=Smallanthus sonchifolius TaxID=185202 RepID=A0ACB9G3F2_9ASTR|nr:hypothetical protein L1987_47733 [Smallanthus sonchifolius]